MGFLLVLYGGGTRNDIFTRGTGSPRVVGIHDFSACVVVVVFVGVGRVNGVVVVLERG